MSLITNVQLLRSRTNLARDYNYYIKIYIYIYIVDILNIFSFIFKTIARVLVGPDLQTLLTVGHSFRVLNFEF